MDIDDYTCSLTASSDSCQFAAYLKAPLPLDRGWRRGRARDTWLLVGAGIAAVALLLLLIALLGLVLSKRKRNKRRVLAGRIQQKEGTPNVGYEDEDDIEVVSFD